MFNSIEVCTIISEAVEDNLEYVKGLPSMISCSVASFILFCRYL